MRRKLSILVLLAILTVSGQIYAIDLIPQPVEMKLLDGSLTLTRESTIGYNQPEARNVAEMLAGKLRLPTGFAFKAQQGNAGTIQLRLNQAAEAPIGKEGYVLESTPQSIVISANQPVGLFYGAQTLLQLLPKEIESKSVVQANWSVPGVRIVDYPRFGWRGMMLDVSRHFFPKEDVKAFIDQMTRFKFNTFHWHLTDDHGWRIEIKSLPKLTEVGAWRVPRAGHFHDRAAPRPGEAATVGGFYTHEDIAEIVQYARERFVMIVPEIDVPGHSMAAIAAYPELSTRKDPSTRVDPGTAFSEWYGNGTFKMLVENTLNPSDENVYVFLDKVFTEVAALFPSPYIHMGGDEAYMGYWADDPGCQALMKKLNTRHLVDLQGYFVNRLEAILKAKGKKLLGWDEILEGGISPEATVMSWRGVKGGIEAAEMGHDVVMSPMTHAYLDHCQGDPTVDPPIYGNLRMRQSYSFNPVPEGVDPKRILGGQGNLWTEQVPTLRHAQYMAYPRGWALAEVYWSPQEKRNWEDFVTRVEAHFDRFDVADVNYSRAMYDAIVETSGKDGKLVLTLDSEVPGVDIYFTIDDTMPDHRSRKYTAPVDLPEGPITLRVVTYRAGKPVGHLITLPLAELRKRAVN